MIFHSRRFSEIERDALFALAFDEVSAWKAISAVV